MHALAFIIPSYHLPNQTTHKKTQIYFVLPRILFKDDQSGHGSGHLKNSGRVICSSFLHKRSVDDSSHSRFSAQPRKKKGRLVHHQGLTSIMWKAFLHTKKRGRERESWLKGLKGFKFWLQRSGGSAVKWSRCKKHPNM